MTRKEWIGRAQRRLSQVGRSQLSLVVGRLSILLMGKKQLRRFAEETRSGGIRLRACADTRSPNEVENNELVCWRLCRTPLSSIVGVVTKSLIYAAYERAIESGVVAGKLSDDLVPGTRNNIRNQAGLR